MLGVAKVHTSSINDPHTITSWSTKVDRVFCCCSRDNNRTLHVLFIACCAMREQHVLFESSRWWGVWWLFLLMIIIENPRRRWRKTPYDGWMPTRSRRTVVGKLDDKSRVRCFNRIFFTHSRVVIYGFLIFRCHDRLVLSASPSSTTTLLTTRTAKKAKEKTKREIVCPCVGPFSSMTVFDALSFWQWEKFSFHLPRLDLFCMSSKNSTGQIVTDISPSFALAECCPFRKHLRRKPAQ